MKKRRVFLAFSTLILFGIFAYLPIVPQYNLMEVLWEEGGYIEEIYSFSSLKEIIQYIDCALNCFPSTDDTRLFNITAIVVSSVLYLGLAFLISWLLAQSKIYAKLFKKKS